MHDELIKRFGTIQVEGLTHKIDATREEIEAFTQQEKEEKAQERKAKEEEERRLKNEYFKREEIEDHWDYFLQACDADFIKENMDDLHNHAFNNDYYIIGRYKATQWLEDQVFNIINIIKEYEQDNFGEVTTDLSEPEKVVNMYTYIVGKDVYGEWRNKQDEDWEDEEEA